MSDSEENIYHGKTRENKRKASALYQMAVISDASAAGGRVGCLSDLTAGRAAYGNRDHHLCSDCRRSVYI